MTRLPTILIVDDEVALCKVLQKTLAREGYSCLIAKDGLEALKIIKKQKINLILLDLQMPYMNGLEFLQKATKINKLPPTIILTAYGSLSSAREAMQLGATDYLTKPFDLNEVVRVVKENLKEPLEAHPLKKLIYIPILHTSHDMGSMAGAMKETYVKKFGEQKWQEHVQVIGEMWDGIKKRIEALNLPFNHVKVYQDGLPECGKEKEIVRELAGKGSPNHQIVQWLIDQGAQLVGTEDPKLLLEEYNHIKKISEAKTHQEKEKLIQNFTKGGEKLLRKRDEKIRNQILTTLKNGETGILFIGLLHRVDELLPKKMNVTYLIHRLPFRRRFEMEMVA